MSPADPCRYLPIVALGRPEGPREVPFAVEVHAREPHARLACAIGVLVAAHQARPDRSTSVMVSLSDAELARLELRSLAASLVDAGIPPELLMIRVPHYATGTLSPVLEALVATGVTVVVGVLTVSPGDLERLAGAPVDIVELPPGLVDEVDRSPDGRRGVEAWMELAHRLDWLVLARNVRRPTQAQVLHGLGCDLAAGPLMGAPVDPAQLGASSRLAG